MFSKTTLFATILVACIGASAAPQDIWDPTITAPTAGTVWAAGSTQLVTWDTSNAPVSISEKSLIVLAKGSVEDSSNPLAEGFDLRAGSVSITVPVTTVPGDDYAIVLFGDSGSLSPQFTIV